MIDMDKSIEELENNDWGEPQFGSYIVTTCHRARRKPLKLLSNEEIRCLLGQKTGLRFLLPIAVDILEEEPLIEVTYFSGDLLLALLRLDKADWKYNPNELEKFIRIIQDNKSQIERCKDISCELIEKYGYLA